MKADDKPDLPLADLELSKTRLRVEDGELVRRSTDDGIVTRLPMDDVEDVRLVRPLNPLAAVGFALAGGLAALGRFVAESNVLTVLLYVVAMFLGAFVLVGLRTDVIVIRSRGKDIRIESPDSTDEVTGFVASVQHRIGGGRSSH